MVDDIDISDKFLIANFLFYFYSDKPLFSHCIHAILYTEGFDKVSEAVKPMLRFCI